MEAKFYIVSVKNDRGSRDQVFAGFELENAADALFRHERKGNSSNSKGVMFQQTWKELPLQPAQ